MTRIRGSLDIARPVAEVFDTVADQRNEPRYNPRMTASTKLTDGPIGVGTRFEATVLSRGKPLPISIEYTDFERPHRIASRSVMAGAVAAGRIRCDPIASGTRFSWDWTVTLTGAARLAGPVVGLVGRRQERDIWTGLKHLLEGGTQGAAAARLPPRWFIVLFWRAHRAWFRLTGGRSGLWPARPGRSGAMRVTTTGRHSGQPRSVILAYLDDGPNLVTMAMNGWDPAEPAWWLNLQADPHASVQLTTGTRPVTARAATGTERARLWELWRSVDRNLDAYAGRRPGRTAVVVLEPAEAVEPGPTPTTDNRQPKDEGSPS
ncbi:MAG TPA: nitroreductase/quinone reductase family protein [Microlunatus sp.]|nr:nitroreductase/quinone reductase family protein [Microlunatus sp.]